jgi:hypothetical protein
MSSFTIVSSGDGRFGVFARLGGNPVELGGHYWHTREDLHSRLASLGLYWIGKQVRRHRDGKPVVALVGW